MYMSSLRTECEGFVKIKESRQFPAYFPLIFSDFSPNLRYSLL